MITEFILYLLYNAIIIIALIFCAVYLYFKYSYTYWKKLNIPFVKPEFPYGTSKETVQSRLPFGALLQTFYERMKAQGHKYFGIYFFQNPIFVPIDAQLVKNILVKDFAYFIDRGVYHNEESDPLSATLFSLNGQRWKNLRAKLSPTFTSGKLKKMFDTLVDCSKELKYCLNPLIEKDEPIDIKQFLAQYTTDVIGSCAFGIECNSFKNPDADFIRLGRKVFSAAGWDRVRLFFVFSAPKIAKLLNLRVTNTEVDTFYRNLVKDTIEYREKNNVTRNDFMQLLIQLKNNGMIEEDESDEPKVAHEIGTTLTLLEATAQAFIFFVAGFETSSTALTFCLFELAQHVEIQNKTRDEIIRVLRKHDNKITYESLSEMHYTERVIQESLRILPPVTILQREVNSDYHIVDSDVVLPKGTTVMIPIYGLHTDPEFYPNPEIFDPERFTAENKNTRPDYSFIPFGEGPRNCIGFRFAMMQIKVGLVQMLLNYKLTLNPKTKLPIEFDARSFILNTKETLWFNAERITN